MTAKDRVPKIRFKGFTETWEQCKFDYFFDERNERSGDGEMISVTINSGIKKFNELGRFDTKPTDLSKYKRVVKGDIAYNSMRMWQGASGYSNYTGILSPAYTVIVPKNGVSSLFFSYQIKRPQMIHQFKISSQGLTKDTWNLKFPAFSQIETSAPKELCEQEKISALLTKLDNLITLHQRKYDKFSQLKKALLEKMFPQEGESVPQIRFKGFTETWEQCEFWAITIWDKNFNEVDKVKQPKIIKYPYVLADVFKQIEDNTGDIRLLSTGNYIGYTTKEQAGSNLCEGEIVAIPWGGTPNIKYFKGKFVTADNRIATSNNLRTLSNRYLYLWMQSQLKYLESIYRGASIQHPSMSDVLDMKISLPSIEEQEHIASVLFDLDNLITLHQRYIEKLKNIKSALLEKMFI